MTAIAYDYPEDVRMLLDAVGNFLKTKIFPLHQKHERLLSDQRLLYERDGRFAPDVLRLIHDVRVASAQEGFYAMCAPQHMGGGGFPLVAYFAVWEQIFRMCGMKYWLGHHVLSHWAKGPSAVLDNLHPDAKAILLPDIMSGKATLCFGLSEPEAGSDAAMIKTRATPDRDGWRLNGNKIWTTNSPHADYAVIFAVTDPERAERRAGGISTFIVPTASTGFNIEKVIRMWGSPGGDEAMLHFDNVRLEPMHLVGSLHSGFRTAMLGVNLGRIYNSARVVGIGRWALEMAFEYAKVRRTFGRPLSEYQGVMFPLAESAMQVHAAHLMSLNVAQLIDRGATAQKELSMTKAFAVEAGVKAVDRVIQLHGAIGMTNEMHLTDAYITMRKINVADGTNEILRRQIVKQMLAGDLAL
ncbi:acyl-CoA dehydrogenase family protein [Bradyrhizobium iriomotense]|uniref:acyl-CoA dehydrogenase family protein n=1 Tax=Bradyrhizobium iriomotense TaxID=441950 RepID=UPI001B89F0D1|nr:acyl-CoA dehydrogenase family protein [Bradyrhizobium iriomotense]MBR0781902.1 acyl-CoA dehydrogenase family protein [Bradyrhizobium iriomotense]